MSLVLEKLDWVRWHIVGEHGGNLVLATAPPCSCGCEAKAGRGRKRTAPPPSTPETGAWATFAEAARFYRRAARTIRDWADRGLLDVRVLPSGKRLVRLRAHGPRVNVDAVMSSGRKRGKRRRQLSVDH